MRLDLNDMIHLANVDGSVVTVTVHPKDWSAALRGKVTKMLQLSAIVGGYQSKTAQIVKALAVTHNLDFSDTYHPESVRMHRVPERAVAKVEEAVIAEGARRRVASLYSPSFKAQFDKTLEMLRDTRRLSFEFRSVTHANEVRMMIAKALPDDHTKKIEGICKGIKDGVPFTVQWHNR
jgi:hypothetical protein